MEVLTKLKTKQSLQPTVTQPKQAQLMGHY